VRASVAYKGCWVRRTRTFAKDDADRRTISRAEVWLDRVTRSLEADKPLASQIMVRLKDFPAPRWSQ